jgi:hypothetical protein
MGFEFDIFLALRYNTQVLLTKGGNLYDEKCEKLFEVLFFKWAQDSVCSNAVVNMYYGDYI